MLELQPASELKSVGRDVPRIDAMERLTGAALYTGDLALPGMLHAKLLRSPHARARIVRIDTQKARALPGVHAILTGTDLDVRVGLYLVDKYVLARDVVRHHGEGVAAVAAESPEIAQRAVELIEVEYEPLPPVLDPVRALDADAPLVHPDLGRYDHVREVFTPVPGTNIANLSKYRKGDVDAGLALADLVIEREYTNPHTQHVPMETHVAIGQWLLGDKVTLWTSAQSPFTVRKLFCHSFKLPHNNVRVLVPAVGGAFGGKAGIHLEPLAASLSRAAGGRPVRIQATREEEFSLLPCRSGLVYRIRTGVTRDGRIVAQRMTLYWDAGAYADYAVNVCRASGYSCTGPYEIPNAWADSYAVYTNKPFGTAYRGFGHVEFSWGLERHMDTVARAIEMDPLQFRLRNALRPGSVTLTGERITEHTGDVSHCMRAVARAIGYGEPLGQLEQRREDESGRRVGKAVVALHKAPAMPPFTATVVILKMNEDGSVVANLSLTEIGAGTYTGIAQIVAEALRFPMEKVKLALDNDTDRDPYDWQTVASKGLLLSGNAAILAARDLLEKAYAVAAEVLRAQPCDLDHDADRIFVRHRPEASVPFARIAVGYAHPNGNAIGGPLVGVGRYIAQGLTNLDKETGQGLPALDWTYGAHGLVVEVDPSTGEYAVLKVASAFDVGRAVAPGIVRGQVIGGIVQGLGTAMCEGYIYDSEGRLLNPSFTDNKIPTALDIPDDVEAIVVETPQVDGPYGARGVGEHPMIAVCAALGNAIQNACGADLLHMPIRQEDVWRALRTVQPQGESPATIRPRAACTPKSAQE
jgi:CO/xanthine dehydrogenase Mo-binding subunit